MQLEKSIVCFRDIKMKILRSTAPSIEPGELAHLYTLTWCDTDNVCL